MLDPVGKVLAVEQDDRVGGALPAWSGVLATAGVIAGGWGRSRS